MKNKPNYPTRKQIQPHLLTDTLPANWKPLAALAGALLLASCDNPKPQTTSQTQASTTPSTQPAITVQFTSLPPIDTLQIAPIFLHGQGRGAAGCVAISPPVFLSEEDALNIIKEQLTPTGLNLQKTTLQFPTPLYNDSSLEFKKILKDLIDNTPPQGKDQEYHNLVDDLEKQIQKSQITLSPQLVDPDNHIAIVYISRQNHNSLDTVFLKSTAQHYDLIQLAANLSNALANNPEPWRLVFFYDPMTKPIHFVKLIPENPTLETDFVYSHEDLLPISRNDLQNQVRDFAFWLKQQEKS